MQALQLLDQLVDESDPDVDFPNSLHAYQTAEGIRRAHPDKGGVTRTGGGGSGWLSPLPGLWMGGLMAPAYPPLPPPLQIGSNSWGCCTIWARSWCCSGSPR